MPKIRRALLSVTDKTGLVDFARGLHELGVELISTGGTAAQIRAAGIPVRDVAEVTGFPEMLDGRVKTIHPAIAGGVLAMRSRLEHMRATEEHGIPLIDLVAVNLYAFEKVAARADATVQELIENIDIGGPTMIRAAAKNYQDVAVVVDPGDYAGILIELGARGGELAIGTTWTLAKKAFALTATYDQTITARLASIDFTDEGFTELRDTLPGIFSVAEPRKLALRYGENPHQQAALYGGSGGIAGARQIQGKELSYNNLIDLDAAWQLVAEFDRPAAAIIKHTNPCGCAEQETLCEAYVKAFEADPVSAFGGVLAFNRCVDEDTAKEIAKTFIEGIAAPEYSAKALSILAAKKNLRLLEVPAEQLDATETADRVPEVEVGLRDRGARTPEERAAAGYRLRSALPQFVVKSISGGYLVQTSDHVPFDRGSARVVTERAPSEEEWAALEFAWRVVKHVKSNAIVYARAGQSVSAGAGQMSRVDSVKVGAMKAVLPLAGCVLASDAFFPFPDGVEEAARHGITAVIQPGGSVKDEEVIAAANRLGVAMVFTGVRHFRH